MCFKSRLRIELNDVLNSPMVSFYVAAVGGGVIAVDLLSYLTETRVNSRVVKTAVKSNIVNKSSCVCLIREYFLRLVLRGFE